jgi:hypothetical protein
VKRHDWANSFFDQALVGVVAGGHDKASLFVMPGLDPGIHAHCAGYQNVDGRDKPGHDGRWLVASAAHAALLVTPLFF